MTHHAFENALNVCLLPRDGTRDNQSSRHFMFTFYVFLFWLLQTSVKAEFSGSSTLRG